MTGSVRKWRFLFWRFLIIRVASKYEGVCVFEYMFWFLSWVLVVFCMQQMYEKCMN